MKWLRYWLPTVVWAVMISWASTNSFSSSHTSRVIVPLLQWIFPHASPATLDFLHLLIRKSAHVTEYGIFSLLLFRSVRGTNRGWQARWVAVTMSIVAVYALLDEYHQSFVPSRGAHVTDSLLDTCAGALAQLLLWWWIRTRERRKAHASGNRDPVAAG